MSRDIFIDNQVVSNVVFYPRKSRIPNDLSSDIKIIEIELEDSEIIGAVSYINNKDYPTIILFHGNGEVALDYLYFKDLFFACGVNLIVADFRGYGFSSGKPYYTSLLKDALPIYSKLKNWLDDNSFLDSVFVQGRSLGSACASEIGANNPPKLKGMIFESGFASIYNMMTRLFRIQSPKLTPKLLSKYSNDIRLRNFNIPVLIIHGSSDWIIPVSEAELIYKNLPNSIEKKLLIIEGAGHNNIFNYEKQYFKALKQFIDKYK